MYVVDLVERGDQLTRKLRDHVRKPLRETTIIQVCDIKAWISTKKRYSETGRKKNDVGVNWGTILLHKYRPPAYSMEWYCM